MSLRGLLTLPVRIVRGLKEFVDPQLKAGRIPLARTVVVLQLIAALVFVGYTLIKKEIQLPFSSEPYLVDVALPDGAGLDPGKEPTASVAGASAGRVIGVRQEGGQAIATLRLDPELQGKIFADATASLRPLNVLQVLVVNIDPGDPASGPLAEGQEIASDRTDVFVPIDELTSVLDADTQAQVRILIREAASALQGREPELRKVLVKLADLSDTATPLARALDERRLLLANLVDQLDVLASTLGERGEQLVRTIDAGNETLAVTADRRAADGLATGLAVLDRALHHPAGFAQLGDDALHRAGVDPLPVPRHDRHSGTGDRGLLRQRQRGDVEPGLDRGVRLGEPVQRHVGLGHGRVEDAVGPDRTGVARAGPEQRERPVGGPVHDHLAGAGHATFVAVAVGEDQRCVGGQRSGVPDEGAGAVAEGRDAGEVGTGCGDGGGGGGLWCGLDGECLAAAEQRGAERDGGRGKGTEQSHGRFPVLTGELAVGRRKQAVAGPGLFVSDEPRLRPSQGHENFAVRASTRVNLRQRRETPRDPYRLVAALAG